MGFSALADMSRHIPDRGRSSPRESNVTGLGLHHNADVDAYGQASAAGREVSANYWIANNGALIPNVDENRRAWTSGHPAFPAGAAADHRNITVEISNSPEGVRDGTWAISAAARKTLVALIADVYRRYNLGPVRRGADKGVGVHRDWVQTECPGGYVMAELPSIIAEAEKLRTNNATTNKPAPTPAHDSQEDDMARNSGIYWPVSGKKNTFSYATFNTTSGFWASFGAGEGKGHMAGAYNNGVAGALDTPPWTETTEGHAKVIEAACAAVRANKA